MSDQGFVKCFIVKGVATILFYHPLGNALPSNLLDCLTKLFCELDQDDDVKVIVIKSHKDRVFCAGASFDELLQIDNLQQGEHFFGGFARVITAMISCKKPIIGRIQGKVVGGGVGIMAACDIVYATKNTSVRLSEISIGIGPFVIEPVISYKIGKSAMFQMAFNPKQWFSADWCLERGLLVQVFDNIEDLDAAIIKKSEEFIDYVPAALQQVKLIFWNDVPRLSKLMLDRAKITGHLVLSDQTKQELKQFRNK